jgi:3-hydroxy-3-methylglutaryl CoA synthase
MTSRLGITGFGGYVPRIRISRAAIAAAHRWMAPSAGTPKGCRALGAWDEDVLTMAVEAARDALPRGERRYDMRALFLVSTRFPFTDVQNATLVAGALDLSANVRTVDLGYSQRAATSGLLAALQSDVSPTMFVASDMPCAKPASAQELMYGAGAAALSLGSEDVLARLIGTASLSAHFVDHFRVAEHDYYWEERWIRDEGYLKLIPPTVMEALRSAGTAASAVDHLVLASPLREMGTTIAQAIGVAPAAAADSLSEICGYAGSAHALLMLVHTLERAQAGQIILWIGFGQGCDALVFRVEEAIDSFRPARGVVSSLADRLVYEDYLRLLSYRGEVELDWGMRAERSIKTALSEQYRSRGQLLRFAAGRCAACGAVQFPQLPYCVNPSCTAPAAQFDQVPLYDAPAHVANFTTDWLSYHPSPPLVGGQIQFENGAKLLMEVVDVAAGTIRVGAPVRMVFRIKDTDRSRGYTRYFWKATMAG